MLSRYSPLATGKIEYFIMHVRRGDHFWIVKKTMFQQLIYNLELKGLGVENRSMSFYLSLFIIDFPLRKLWNGIICTSITQIKQNVYYNITWLLEKHTRIFDRKAIEWNVARCRIEKKLLNYDIMRKVIHTFIYSCAQYCTRRMKNPIPLSDEAFLNCLPFDKKKYSEKRSAAFHFSLLFFIDKKLASNAVWNALLS